MRAAYRAALRRTHPDVAAAGQASDRATAEIVEAYRLLSATSETADRPPPSSTSTAPPPTPAPSASETAVTVEGDTVTADLPAGDLYPLLLDVAERLGEVTHVEPESGLLEFLVELPGRGTCSVLLTLQGRGSGITEAWCTVEPLRGGAPPPADEVATLLAAGMRASLDAVG